MDKDIVINSIRKIFALEKYPGDENLAYDGQDDYEIDLIKQNFIGKLWQNLDNDFILENRNSIYFFSKYAFKYYLPAFMIAIIENFDELDDLPNIIIGGFIATILNIDKNLEELVSSQKVEEKTWNKKFIVSTSLDIKNIPGDGEEIILTIEKGGIVLYLDQVYEETITKTIWYKVSYKNAEGWCIADKLGKYYD